MNKLIRGMHSLQGKLLDNSPAEGISVANQSLVLQNVSRSRAGMYTCVGSNREGDGESNPVHLDINCKCGRLGQVDLCWLKYIRQ